jgi:hypothetical protein
MDQSTSPKTLVGFFRQAGGALSLAKQEQREAEGLAAVQPPTTVEESSGRSGKSRPAAKHGKSRKTATVRPASWPSLRKKYPWIKIHEKPSKQDEYSATCSVCNGGMLKLLHQTLGAHEAGSRHQENIKSVRESSSIRRWNSHPDLLVSEVVTHALQSGIHLNALSNFLNSTVIAALRTAPQGTWKKTRLYAARDLVRDQYAEGSTMRRKGWGADVPFSLQLDESSCRDGVSLTAVVYKNIHTTRLLDVFPGKGKAAVDIKETLGDVMRAHNLRRSSLVAVSRDDASSMKMAVDDFVASTESPMAVAVPCGAQCVSLVQKHFCKHLPLATQLVTDIHNALFGGDDLLARRLRLLRFRHKPDGSGRVEGEAIAPVQRDPEVGRRLPSDDVEAHDNHDADDVVLAFGGLNTLTAEDVDDDDGDSQEADSEGEVILRGDLNKLQSLTTRWGAWIESAAVVRDKWNVLKAFFEGELNAWQGTSASSFRDDLLDTEASGKKRQVGRLLRRIVDRFSANPLAVRYQLGLYAALEDLNDALTCFQGRTQTMTSSALGKLEAVVGEWTWWSAAPDSNLGHSAMFISGARAAMREVVDVSAEDTNVALKLYRKCCTSGLKEFNKFLAPTVAVAKVHLYLSPKEANHAIVRQRVDEALRKRNVDAMRAFVTAERLLTPLAQDIDEDQLLSEVELYQGTLPHRVDGPSPEDFWTGTIATMSFPALSTFARRVLAVSLSMAPCEPVFSRVSQSDDPTVDVRTELLVKFNGVPSAWKPPTGVTLDGHRRRERRRGSPDSSVAPGRASGPKRARHRADRSRLDADLVDTDEFAG